MAAGPRSWIAQLRDLPHLLAALRRDFLFANRRLTAAFIFYCVKLGVGAVLFLVYLVVGVSPSLSCTIVWVGFGLLFLNPTYRYIHLE